MAMARNRGYRAVLWVLLGLLIIGLGGWFTGGPGGTRTARIGAVDGLEIPVQGYAASLRNQMRALGEQTGAPVTIEQAQALGLDRMVLAEVVSQRVLDAETRRLGLSVGDARVAQAVRSSAAFQGIDGQFDRALYREQLRRNNLTEPEFETALREDSARALLQAALVGGVPEPLVYADRLAAWSGERRVVTWAEVGPEMVAATLPEPAEADLRAFWEANPDRFTAPETRTITYAWVTPAMLAPAMSVPEDALRDAYERRRDEFVQPERRLVERLVYPSEEEAQAARARLDAGEASFEALTAERGLRLSDIDLGDVTQAELGGAAEAVFAAPAGSVVGPVATDLGPALFRVNAVLAAQETTLEQAAPELREELAFGQAARAISDEVPRLEDLIAGGATIEDLAEQTALEAGQIDWFAGSDAGIAAYAPFREAAAAAQEGAFPRVIQLGDGGVAVLRLDGVTPPAVVPFEQARPQVEAAWRSERLAEATLARAEAAAAAITAGASFEAEGLSPRTEPPLVRRDFVAGTPPGFVAAAFAMGAGEARAVPVGEAALVVRVDAVQPAPADDPALVAQREAVAAQIGAAMAQEFHDAFARQRQLDLQRDGAIVLDDATIAAVNAQIQ
jgi:peptidyl-prolyl cis-trans isomerase D